VARKSVSVLPYKQRWKDEKFPEQIARVRGKLTQKELVHELEAYGIHVSLSRYKKWEEKEGACPNEDNFIKIEKYLKERAVPTSDHKL
jgi:hypothetical protein